MHAYGPTSVHSARVGDSPLSKPRLSMQKELQTVDEFIAARFPELHINRSSFQKRYATGFNIKSVATADFSRLEQILESGSGPEAYRWPLVVDGLFGR